MNIEKWKDILGFEGFYKVNNIGLVKSKYKILKPFIKNKYQFVILSKNNVTYNKYVHRLVAEAFVSNPLNKTQVNHINFNRLDNHYLNLEWVTAFENNLHTTLNNRRKSGERSPHAKLRNPEVIKIIREYRIGNYTQMQLAEIYGIDQTTISNIVCRKTYKNISSKCEQKR